MTNFSYAKQLHYCTYYNYNNKLCTQLITKWGTYRANASVYLSRICTLFVRIFAGGHLKHAHAKRVHINTLVVLLLVHFWRHELRCTCYTQKYTHCYRTTPGQPGSASCPWSDSTYVIHASSLTFILLTYLLTYQGFHPLIRIQSHQDLFP